MPAADLGVSFSSGWCAECFEYKQSRYSRSPGLDALLDTVGEVLCVISNWNNMKSHLMFQLLIYVVLFFSLPLPHNNSKKKIKRKELRSGKACLASGKLAVLDML